MLGIAFYRGEQHCISPRCLEAVERVRVHATNAMVALDGDVHACGWRRGAGGRGERGLCWQSIGAMQKGTAAGKATCRYCAFGWKR